MRSTTIDMRKLKCDLEILLEIIRRADRFTELAELDWRGQHCVFQALSEIFSDDDLRYELDPDSYAASTYEKVHEALSTNKVHLKDITNRLEVSLKLAASQGLNTNAIKRTLLSWRPVDIHHACLLLDEMQMMIAGNDSHQAIPDTHLTKDMILILEILRQSRRIMVQDDIVAASASKGGAKSRTTIGRLLTSLIEQKLVKRPTLNGIVSNRGYLISEQGKAFLNSQYRAFP